MKVRVTLNPDNTIEVEVEGAVGNECMKATEKLLSGTKVESQDFKPEFYETTGEGEAEMER